jgi:hypothetical protein
MRTSHARLVGAALLSAIAGVGFVTADEVTKQAMPAPEKALASPFFDHLAGSWTTESTGIHDGKETKGTGKATFTKAIGGTALVQTYEMTGLGPDGKTGTFYGHGVTKVGNDGKSATTWWFCNMSPDVMKLTGTLTDSGLELSGTSPHGNPVTVSFTKTADGVAFKMTEGANEMRDSYKRAR